jgi:hypothetical protein
LPNSKRAQPIVAVWTTAVTAAMGAYVFRYLVDLMSLSGKGDPGLSV